MTLYLYEIYGLGNIPSGRRGPVTAVLGGTRYQVSVDRQHTQEAHVDHLQPGVCTEVQAEPVSNPVEGPDSELAMSHAISLRRSSHQVVPTKTLRGSVRLKNSNCICIS